MIASGTQILTQPGGARQLLSIRLTPNQIGLAWLGQAGFLLQTHSGRWVIDPYLSDYLANKYRNARYPHQRMMAAPIGAEELVGVDGVLCTHRHSDHMDPDTLPVLAAVNPRCCFVAPAAERDAALRAGIPGDRTIWADAGQTHALGDGAQLHVLPAAHETLETDAAGQHRYLGYVLQLGAISIYHSGDTVPFASLVDELKRLRPTIALLPVNGRDETRRDNGVPGNLTAAEAVQVCRQADIPHLICHHFGMFDFNTIDEADLRQTISTANGGRECIVPSVDTWYLLETESERP